MKFTEAFERLGYKIASPRQDWSAEKTGGVCITLWRVEMGQQNGGLWVDTKIHSNDNSIWRAKPGNSKRTKHLQRALEEFDGLVDVVIVHGAPGFGFGDADPWLPEKRKGSRWRVLSVDPETGHFEARLETSAAVNNS